MWKRQRADDRPVLTNYHQYNDELDPKKFKINDDDNGTLLSDCTTTNNDTAATTCITLIDNDINLKTNIFNLLKLKFHNQQLGKKLWLERRELKHYEFIPIEFSKDLYFVSNFIKRMNQNRKYCPYFRENWYGADCLEMLSDKLKQEIDTIPYFEITNSFISYYTRKQPDFASLNDKISRISSKSETKCIEMICLLAKIVINVDYFISEYHSVFPFIHKVLKLLSDEEFLLKCISSSCKVFKFVKDKVNKQQDLKFILKCVNMNPKVLQYIDSKCPIFNDKQLIMKLFQSMKTSKPPYGIFNKLSTDLKTDREIVLLAAEKGYPEVYYILGKEFNNDREIVLQSVRRNGSLLRHVSDNLKNDREIVVEAINCIRNTSRCAPLVFASILLKQDRELILLSIKKYPETLGNAPSELLSNREFILECVKINGFCLQYLTPLYKSDIEIVIEAIKQNPFSFYFSNIKTIDCKNELLSVVERLRFTYLQDGYVHQMFLSSINDLEIAMKLIEINPFSIHFLNGDIITKCQELTYKSTLLHNGYWMKHCEDAYQERINHAYYSAKIDSNSNGGGDEINYYRNVNKTNLLWKDLEWNKW